MIAFRRMAWKYKREVCRCFYYASPWIGVGWGVKPLGEEMSFEKASFHFFPENCLNLSHPKADPERRLPVQVVYSGVQWTRIEV